MKIDYICEVCGKHYNNEVDVIRCEEGHKRKDEDAQKEAALLEAISDATNLYVSRYHKMPAVVLTEENQEILINELLTRMIIEPIYENAINI